MADLRKILEKFSLLEGQNAQQKSVPQLPADFNAGDISTVLGHKEKAHPTHNYFVGEEDASHNGVSPDTKEILESHGDSPVARAIANRIIRQYPEMITDYGIEYLMQAIDDEAERVGDVDEIGSSDVSAWIQNIKRDLDGRLTREGMVEDSEILKVGSAVRVPHKGKMVPGKVVRYDSGKGGYSPAYVVDIGEYESKIVPVHDVKQGIAEGVATEDVLSTVKKKLGDYLKNIEDEIKSDPDLKDKLDKDIDVVGPAVKTLTTDDGHEIKIHGNEDDGFRITIQNKPAKSTFKDLDEASMAVEMFNARRRRAAMPAPKVEIEVKPEVKVAPRAALLQRLKPNNDYVDEK